MCHHGGKHPPGVMAYQADEKTVNRGHRDPFNTAGKPLIMDEPEKKRLRDIDDNDTRKNFLQPVPHDALENELLPGGIEYREKKSPGKKRPGRTHGHHARQVREIGPPLHRPEHQGPGTDDDGGRHVDERHPVEGAAPDPVRDAFHSLTRRHHDEVHGKGDDKPEGPGEAGQDCQEKERPEEAQAEKREVPFMEVRQHQ